MTSMEKLFNGYAERQKKALQNTSSPFSKGIAWIEGQFVPLHDARIPILDQGFLKGDLTYDVPGVWDGRFFRLDDHMTRLENSCSKIRLRLPLPRDRIKQLLIQMVGKSGIRDAYVELLVTRGLKAVRGSTAEELRDNRLYLLVMPYVWVMPPEVQQVGGSAIVTKTVRRTPPDAMDPTVKNVQWGDLTRGMFEAADRGAAHPFLTDGDANVTEGSGFNIIIVKDGVLHTPAQGVLEGITRKSVIDAARMNGLEVRVDLVSVEMAYEADEIFTCTTAGGIMPITKLDGRRVGDGTIGPLTKRIWDTYWAMHWDPAFSFAIPYEDVTPASKL